MTQPTTLVPRSDCRRCKGTGNEYWGRDDTGLDVSFPYCDYCSETARCLDCNWKGDEGERIVVTLDELNGSATGNDLLCPTCGGNDTELYQCPS